MDLNFAFTRKITNFDYDDDQSVLTIYFNSGIIKKYINVPKTIYKNLMKSMDKNHYYQAAIDGAYCVE